MYAAGQAGITSVPAVVKTDLSDEEAEVYVIETNLLQRSFQDLKISEQAFAVGIRYSKLFDEQALFQKNATYYHRTMFDEVYHARTAYEFLNRLSVYENTHPPLGKTIISLGIRAFGMNPFGWRIMCALCGILMVPVIYLFAHRMFGTTGSASFATLLLCTEFMHFTL